MSVQVTDDVSAAALAGYDMIIDVRSPGEFAEDHVPGAVNLPVLNNEERAAVGTMYVQDSRFKARRMGAALVAANVARHLQTALADKDGSFKPLVYCWRGGMRSNAMAHILSQVGWRTGVLAGGYKTYRKWVVHRLYDTELPHRFLLLDGRTGAGKTALLERLAGQGAQVLDLEDLAAHRGSIFGGRVDREQPSQKLFESRLLGVLDRLEPSRVVLAEAESSKVGERMVPPAIWSRLAVAPRIEIRAERHDRALHTVAGYPELTTDRARLDEGLARLPVKLSPERAAAWRAMADKGEWVELAEAIMAQHYDRAYDEARKRHDRPLVDAIDLDPNNPAQLDAAVARIAAHAATLDVGAP